MAGITDQVFMGTFQRIIGLRDMIKAPEFPASRVMAAETVRTQGAAVFVVTSVAGLAYCGRALERVG